MNHIGASFARFPESPLKLLTKPADFDSPIRRFDPSRPSQITNKVNELRGFHSGNEIPLPSGKIIAFSSDKERGRKLTVLTNSHTLGLLLTPPNDISPLASAAVRHNVEFVSHLEAIARRADLELVSTRERLTGGGSSCE